MAKRISALLGHYVRDKTGTAGEAGVVLHEVGDLSLHQIAAWPDTLDAVAKQVAHGVGITSPPGPGSAVQSVTGALLRIEPLKWWMLGGEIPTLSSEQGTTLDLSHSRTHLRVTGAHATTLLNRHVALDLRAKSFPRNAVASGTLHHVGVTLWHSQQGYELFIPRGFALSVWQVLLEGAAQFGVEIQ